MLVRAKLIFPTEVSILQLVHGCILLLLPNGSTVGLTLQLWVDCTCSYVALCVRRIGGMGELFWSACGTMRYICTGAEKSST